MAQPAYQSPEPGPVRPVSTVSGPVRNYGLASMGARIVLTLLGAAGLVVSAFMNWITDVNGVNLNIRALWQDNSIQSETSTFVGTVGFAVIVLGLLAIVGLAARSGWLTRLAGAVTIAGFVLFAIQVYRSDLHAGDIQMGGWVALIGGVVALIGGFLGARTVVAPTTRPAVVAEP
jgi:uncharacterized membrane protein YgdD (TMEM256/DUF423 family)